MKSFSTTWFWHTHDHRVVNLTHLVIYVKDVYPRADHVFNTIVIIIYLF